MILFHYTAAEYLPDIMRDGLTTGEVTVSPVGPKFAAAA